MSSSPDTFSPNAYVCAVYIDMAAKTEATSKKSAKKEKNAIFQKRAKEMVKLLWNAKFAPWEFKLDYQRAPPMALVVVDAIGLQYRRLSFQAKTIFHTEQIKVEIMRLRMLTTQCCRYINKM